MKFACPHCGHPTRVVATETLRNEVRRRRACDQGHRFNTSETVGEGIPRVPGRRLRTPERDE